MASTDGNRATIVLWYTYADGETVGARIDMPTPYPDALSEGAKTVADAFRAAMVNGIELTTADPDDQT